MREIVTAVEMKELDHNTIQKAGISSPVLMERAALKTVEEIVQRLKNKEKEKILVVCGTGNNGGDGLAIARLLQLRGVRTWYYIAVHRKVENLLKLPDSLKQQNIIRCPGCITWIWMNILL